MAKLNPEDLVVSSFDTATPAGSLTDTAVAPTIQDPNHPTPMTYCFVCD